MPIFKCKGSKGSSKLSYSDLSGRPTLSTKGGETWSCSQMSLPPRK